MVRRTVKILLIIFFLTFVLIYFYFLFLFWGLPFNGQRHGNPPLTPAWALECWLWEDDYNTSQYVDELLAGLCTALDAEAEDGPLSLRQVVVGALVVGVARKSGVVDPLDRFVCLEVLGPEGDEGDPTLAALVAEPPPLLFVLGPDAARSRRRSEADRKGALDAHPQALLLAARR